MADDINDEDMFRILIATDCHLGYLEKDQVRGKDSLETFEEILEIGKNYNVDFVLLGGDLFHENKPSRKTRHACMALLRKYCMGDKSCQVEFLSDQSINFSTCRFPVVNYEDPNLNISMPVFSIHGNHDDPAGDGNLCALDLLSVCGLVNYFGRPSSVDDITISPLLLQKGSAKMALYGLGSIRDERLHRTFISQRVKILRPKEDQDSWFNLLVLHQNRAKHGPTNYIPEKFLDPFLDLIFWGHEHECLIEPMHADDPTLPFYITQPGSSVATSLSIGESKKKHVGILEIKADKAFQITKVPLKTVRPFYMEDIVLSRTDLDPTEEEKVMAFLTEKVEQLICKSESEHTGSRRQPTKPLIRLKVDYSGGFASFNTQRFGQQFVDRVANPRDIILFYRKKEASTKKDAQIRPDVDERLLHLRPEALDDIRMEDLIKEYLTSKNNALELSILSENRMAQALHEFVEKDENDAIGTLVSWQLTQTQKHLKQRNNLQGDEIEREAKKFTERRRLREEENDEEEEEEVRKVLAEHSRSVIHDNDDDENDSDESTTSRPPAKRGRGRGRGSSSGSQRGSTRGRGSRGGRGRGEGRGRGRGSSQSASRTKNTLITDSFTSGTGASKHNATVISSSDEEDGFTKAANHKPPTQKKAPFANSRSKKTAITYDDESDESDNPFYSSDLP